ncbi:MAG TPA: hypothetical protein VGF74_18135 [Thermoleophilaceae bacterium]|jgi:hypothetical protein
MDPIQPISPLVSNIPSIERVGHRVDPDQQRREQEKKDGQRERRQPQDPEEPEEDDGLPHIDVCC